MKRYKLNIKKSASPLYGQFNSFNHINSIEAGTTIVFTGSTLYTISQTFNTQDNINNMISTWMGILRKSELEELSQKNG